jgi:hypothetical protein
LYWLFQPWYWRSSSGSSRVAAAVSPVTSACHSTALASQMLYSWAQSVVLAL